MLDIDSGEQIEAIYRMVQIKGGKRVEKFKTTDINRALKYHKWYVARYKEGLYMEILPETKVYDWKEKKVIKTFGDIPSQTLNLPQN